MKPMHDWGSAEIAEYNRQPAHVFVEPLGVTPSQGTAEVERQEIEYRRSFIREYWLVVIFIGLVGFLSITAPQWETMDPGACETEAC